MYWKIASLLIFLIFAGWVYYESHRTVRIAKKREEAFWERELLANSVRKKPLTNLEYITIPENLPYELHNDDPDIASYIGIVRELSKEKIVNFTGWTNTDLKLEYGTANITHLSIYDQNYTTLVTTLQKWADVLIELGERDAAIPMLEFCVSTKADIGKTYRILADYYFEKGDDSAIQNLIDVAKELKSLNKNAIVESLKEFQF